jgi:hypothetical protein
LREPSHPPIVSLQRSRTASAVIFLCEVWNADAAFQAKLDQLDFYGLCGKNQYDGNEHDRHDWRQPLTHAAAWRLFCRPIHIFRTMQARDAWL